ncbi:MaoC family dehydratase [Phytohabitans sp. LJ34]|uniref:MaoC family dehydratase n=1 Tax=Phytohabitans sp. LJ34 TaxID=3452217 RepID=UPI003F8A7DA1
MLTVNGLDELRNLAGTTLGPGDWWDITQERVDRFADATGDHQWIHVDAERARTGPFGGTIAHGYLTVSLLVPMWTELLRIDGIGMGVNYGLNKLRFPSPLPVGSKIRLHAHVESAREAPGGAVDLTLAMTVERDGADKPVAVAEVIYRYFP